MRAAGALRVMQFEELQQLEVLKDEGARNALDEMLAAVAKLQPLYPAPGMPKAFEEMEEHKRKQMLEVQAQTETIMSQFKKALRQKQVQLSNSPKFEMDIVNHSIRG